MPHVPVEDRLAIQEVSARYAFFCDTKQYEKIDQVFADDGIFDESILGLPVTQGNAAIRELFMAVGATAKFMIHINSNHIIHEYAGDTASGTSHLHVESELTDGSSMRILGYYADDYVRKAGKWLLKQRKLVAIAPL